MHRLNALAAMLGLGGLALVGQPQSERHVEPPCKPGGCPAPPVPYPPVKARDGGGGATAPVPEPQAYHNGDEAGTPSGRPHKPVGPRPVLFRNAAPAPTPPRNSNGQKPPG